jgi:hypothetical protein
LLVKSHPLPVVMTVARYGFRVVVPLWMAPLVKKKMLYVIFVAATYSWKNELGSYFLFLHLAWWSGYHM